MAEDNNNKQFTESEIVKAQANILAGENGLKKAHPESDITSDDIKKYISRIKKEKNESVSNFLEGKEQMSFDSLFSSEPPQNITPEVKVNTTQNIDDIEKIVFVEAEPTKLGGVKFSPDSEEFLKTKAVWDSITDVTTQRAIERDEKNKGTEFEWMPEKNTQDNVENANSVVIESTSGNPELKALLREGFEGKFENGLIRRDDFTVYETAADFVDSTPEQTRMIFAKHNEQGVSIYIEFLGNDKNKIRADYPELEGWVTTKQTVKENDFDMDYTASSVALVDRLETMIHSKTLDKKEVNERLKDIESEFDEAKNMEKIGPVSDDVEYDNETSSLDDATKVTPEKEKSKAAKKLKNK